LGNRGTPFDTNIYFDLGWVLVLSTSIWAAIDSKRIELQRYKLLINSRPIVLFSVCSLLWIFIFPWYLRARFKIKAGEIDIKEGVFDKARTDKSFFRRFLRKTEYVGQNILFVFVLAKLVLWSSLSFESWHAPRIWADYKHQLEARGESLDWNDMIPPPVPDVQNFFEVRMMSEWFVKPPGGMQIGDDFQFLTTYTNTTPQILIASIAIGPDSTTSHGAIVLRFDDFESHRKAMQLVQNIAGRGVFDVFGRCILTAEPTATIQVKPLKIFLVTSNTPNIGALKAFFTAAPGPASIVFTRIESNSYNISAYFSSANDYLKWSDQFDADFNLIRDAVKQPYARINGNYNIPTSIPIPNFISLRNVSETLAQRAKCYLLLGQPDKALQELTLFNNLRRVLEFAPSNKPMSLVTAMINVAILGLYANTINDGFQLNAWEEPQLETLESQLQQINLAPFLRDAFHEDEVALLRTAQQTIATPYDIQRNPDLSLSQKLGLVHYRNFMSAFYYLNIMNIIKMDEPILSCIDPGHDIVWPQRVDAIQREHDKFFNVHFWQFDKLLALIGVPNFSRALEVFTFNQNEANEAEIACALERYHLAHNKYPNTLDDLVPQFINQLPHDIIDGVPLKYRPISNDRFGLYSVGWDETGNGDQYKPFVNGKDWIWL